MTTRLSTQNTPPENGEEPIHISNRDLFLPYLAPYFAYVSIVFFFDNRLSVEIIYALRLIIVPVLLIWAWRWYFPLTGPKSPIISVAVGAVAGLAGCLLWVVLLDPFIDPQEGEIWSDTGFYLRLAAAALVVPIFEELFVRGYIFRVALQWDQARKLRITQPFETAIDKRCITDVEPGAWTTLAVAISTIGFALGHHVVEWPASLAYGLLMMALWIIRKDMLSCIVAHGVTNFTLAFYVRQTGQWGFW